MPPRRSTGAASAHIDLTEATDDESSAGGWIGSPRFSNTPKARQPSPGRTQYESEDEDYINGILLGPAAAKDDDPSSLQRKKKRVVVDSDEDFEPGDSRSASEQPSWDRTGPSLYQSTVKNAKAVMPSWDRTGPSLYPNAAKFKREADNIDWGNDRVAVVIDTPKEWFARQARAREALGVKPFVTNDDSSRRRTPRRIVEVVIPIRSLSRKRSEAVARAPSELSLSNVLNDAGPSKPAQRPVQPPSDSDDDEQPVLRRRTPVRKVLTKKRPPPEGTKKIKGKAKKKRGPPEGKKRIKGKAKKPKRDDPDESSEWSEDGDGAHEIELDEPERFKTATRLREAGPTAWQAKLKALEKLRREREQGTQYDKLPVELPTDSEDESESESEGEESESSGASSDFIVPDGPGGKAVKLPEEFSVQKQPWQYKFKVAFQYLVLLVVRGEDCLPLSTTDAAYFSRPLKEVRSLFKGIQNSIAGQVWPAKFRKALEKYPRFNFKDLKKAREYCTACNRHKQRCHHEAWLGGDPYRRETHAKMDSDDSAYSTSEDEDYELGYLGKVCFQRTQFFHEVAHWEHKLFLRIRSRYHDLIRAKGRQSLIDSESDSLRSGSDESDAGRAERTLARRRSERRVETLRRTDDPPLPRDLRDFNEITQWLDRTGFQQIQLHWLNGLESRGKELERDLLK